jgi:hypothetical protein
MLVTEYIPATSADQDQLARLFFFILICTVNILKFSLKEMNSFVQI